MSKKDIGLLYRPIERLLLSYKVTRPDISVCVSYIIGRMESSTKYQKDKQLNLDMIFVKKIQLFILSFTENRCLHSESIFSKHTKYLLNTIQHMIQSQRLKAILTILGVVYDNTQVWISINLRNDQVNYDNKSQIHTITDVRTTSSKSTNQGVKIANDQCHNIQ